MVGIVSRAAAPADFLIKLLLDSFFSSFIGYLNFSSTQRIWMKR
jgi:hypothetical protein